MILFVAGFLLPKQVAAQTLVLAEDVHIEGVVLKGEDRTAMCGAKVFVMNRERVIASYTTDAKGHFDFIIEAKHVLKPHLRLLFQKSCTLGSEDNKPHCSWEMPAPDQSRVGIKVAMGGCGDCMGCD